MEERAAIRAGDQAAIVGGALIRSSRVAITRSVLASRVARALEIFGDS